MNAKLDPPEGGLERISIVKTSQLLTSQYQKSDWKKDSGGVTTQKMEEINRAGNNFVKTCLPLRQMPQGILENLKSVSSCFSYFIRALLDNSL
jgi:hypothetical protein